MVRNISEKTYLARGALNPGCGPQELFLYEKSTFKRPRTFTKLYILQCIYIATYISISSFSGFALNTTHTLPPANVSYHS